MNETTAFCDSISPCNPRPNEKSSNEREPLVYDENRMFYKLANSNIAELIEALSANAKN